MKCRKCNKHLSFLPEGIWLERVNAKGIPGEFECRPACNTPLSSQGEAILAAIAARSRSKREGG